MWGNSKFHSNSKNPTANCAIASNSCESDYFENNNIIPVFFGCVYVCVSPWVILKNLFHVRDLSQIPSRKAPGSKDMSRLQNWFSNDLSWKKLYNTQAVAYRSETFHTFHEYHLRYPPKN